MGTPNTIPLDRWPSTAFGTESRESWSLMVWALRGELGGRDLNRKYRWSGRTGLVGSERASEEFPCAYRRKIPAHRLQHDRASNEPIRSGVLYGTVCGREEDLQKDNRQSCHLFRMGGVICRGHGGHLRA